MFKKIVSVSAVTAMLILGGCSGGSNTEVTPETSAPTGSNAKLKQAIGNYNSDTKQKLSPVKGLGNKNSLTDLGIDLSQFTLGGENAHEGNGGEAMGAVAGDDADSCINDQIATTESNTSATAKGAITFTNCTLPNGTKINGSITVDFSANGNNDNMKVDYSGSGNMSVVSGDGKAKIVVSEAKTEGKATYKDGKGAAENKSGISAYLEDNSNKFLILDGINTEETNTWGEEGKSYTFKVSGYIGSDDTGMFQVATPVTVKGTHNCPSEGKVTLTDASGSIFAIKANGTNITTDIDGNVTHTYNCGGGASGGDGDDSDHGDDSGHGGDSGSED